MPFTDSTSRVPFEKLIVPQGVKKFYFLNSLMILHTQTTLIFFLFLLSFYVIIRDCLNNVRCENSRIFMSKNGLYEQFTTNYFYHHYLSTL